MERRFGKSQRVGAGWWGVLSACLLSTGCAALMPAPTPMRTVSYENPAGHARCLLVLLPGAGDSAEDFAQHGFVDELRRRPLDVDVLSANATMGYYFRGTLAERLDLDAVQPALARKYEHVWAVGISMGGLGSLLYNLRKPGHVEGVLLLAPYLGDTSLIHEVRDAGGVAKWQAPPAAEPNEKNYQRQLWRWLQALTSGTEKGPELYLGWGTEDRRVGEAAVVLASALPPTHVAQAPGGHDWPAWLPLFSRFLDDSDFSRACAVQ